MTAEKTLGWMDGVARGLVHHAARGAPADLSERLAEEWLADMFERRRGLSRLRFGLGCCWAISVIAREHRAAAGVPAASAAVSAGSAAVAPAHFSYIELAPSYSPRRTATFILIACLHAAVLGGLMLGLTKITKLKPPAPFRTVIVDAVRPPVAPPVISIQGIGKTAIDLPTVPFPPIDIEPTTPDAQAPVATGSDEPGPVLPAAPHTVNRVQGGPGVGFPRTADFYPDASVRKGEQGAATVNACVDVNGRLTSDPTILQSSGSALLDAGALRLARAGSGHYHATTEDGVPVSSCYSFLIRFTLNR